MAIINRTVTEYYDDKQKCVVNSMDVTFCGIHIFNKSLYTSHEEALRGFKQKNLLYTTHKIGFKHE